MSIRCMRLSPGTAASRSAILTGICRAGAASGRRPMRQAYRAVLGGRELLSRGLRRAARPDALPRGQDDGDHGRRGVPRESNDETRSFDPAVYSQQVFGMFRGEQCRMKLRFENSLAGVVLDRFGRDRLLVPGRAGPLCLSGRYLRFTDVPRLARRLRRPGGDRVPGVGGGSLPRFSAPCAFRSRVRQNGNDLFSKYS